MTPEEAAAGLADTAAQMVAVLVSGIRENRHEEVAAELASCDEAMLGTLLATALGLLETATRRLDAAEGVT